MVERLAGAIADAWYDLVRARTSPFLSASETRQLVDRLAQRALDFLAAEGGYDQADVDALARHLLSLGDSAEEVAKLQRVLMEQTLNDAAWKEKGGGVPASTLMADLTSALLRATETSMLDDREHGPRAQRTALGQPDQKLQVLEAVVESSITATALWTLEGEVRYVNPAFLAIWGYDSSEAVEGRQVWDLWERDAATETLRPSLDQFQGWIGKLTAIGADGTRFPVMLAAGLVQRDREEAPWVAGSFVDMTYRQRLNAMVWDRVDRLRALRQVDRGILAARSPQETGEAALSSICRLVPCRGASVTLFSTAESGGFKLLAAVPSADLDSVGAEMDISLEGFEEVVSALERDEIALIHGLDSLPLPEATLRRLKGAAPNTYAAVPLHCEGQLLGSLNLVMAAGSELNSEHRSIAREVADSLAVAIRHAQLDAAIAEHGRQLRALTARLAEVDEKKRRDLARELHDQIGQKLTALGINMNVIKARLDEETHPELDRRLEDSLVLLRETTERVRRVIAALRPPMLDDYGLIATLRWCADELSSRTDVDVSVHGCEPVPRLPPPVEDALVRITQEALTNVAKHADATEATVQFSERANDFLLVIEDNGVGFKPRALARGQTAHWGLLNMRERAQAVGGRCRIESDPGEGTRVVVEVGR